MSQHDHTHSRGDDRERITRARQAAEALFTAKSPVSGPSVPDTAGIQSPRKPRVLRVISPPPAGVEEVKDSVSLGAASARSIPPAHFARIRILVRYGMTVAQVAELYGTEVDEISRILSPL